MLIILPTLLLALGQPPCLSQATLAAPAVAALPRVDVQTPVPVTSALLSLVQEAVTAAAKGDFSGLSGQLSPIMVSALTPQVQQGVRRTYFDPRGSVQKIAVLTQNQAADGVVILMFTISLQRGMLDGLLAVDPTGRIVRFTVTPDPSEAAVRLVTYKTRGAVCLPFAGAWFVVSGGPDPTHNRHADNLAQRYAYDFMIQRSGLSHRGDGLRNTDYFAYGRPVLAPVDGTVVVKVDGVPENMPGERNPYDVFGNYLVIDDGHQEWALLAHFQPYSTRVHVGQHVTAGQELGLCGNSGFSTEPHLHFHMQNSMIVAHALGLPITFHQFLQDGKPVRSGQVPAAVTVQNDQVRNFSHTTAAEKGVTL